MSAFPKSRPRRLRQSPALRALVRETSLQKSQLILPLFVRFGENIQKPIASMPGHHQWSVDRLDEEVASCLQAGIRQIILFGVPEKKDPLGKDSYHEQGIVQTAIQKIKNIAPELLVMVDVCFCEYTDHGHCGVVRGTNEKDFSIDNDATLTLLAKQAVSFAKAGADVIAPSGMMDGGVQAIRKALDEAGHTHMPILSYAVKYASAMYGPFREAAEGAPMFGDRSTHQMDVANAYEALRECELDVQEGADMLMVKPAHTYLDVIRLVKQHYPSIPLGAYHTSGEFAMLKAAAEKGWLDEKKAVLEVLTSIRRAGADFILTYYAKEVATWLAE